MILTKVKGLVDFQNVIPYGISYCDLKPESMVASIEEKYRNQKGREGCFEIRDSALNVFSLKSGVSNLISLYKN